MSHGARLFHTAFSRQPPYPAPPGPPRAQFTPNPPPAQFASAPSAPPSVRPASGRPPAQSAAYPFRTPALKRNHGYPPGACLGGTSLTYPAAAYPAQPNRSHSSYSPNPPAAPLPGRQPGPANFGMVGPAPPPAQATPYFTGTYSSAALPSSSGLGAVLVAILILVVLDLVLVRPRKHQRSKPA